MMKLSRKGAQILKIIHLVFIAIWFGGVMSWFPLIYGANLNNFETTYLTYLNMRSIAWNVIGWGGIGALVTGILNGVLTNRGIFKHRWVTVKFFTVILLILYGMFFLESHLIANIELLENGGSAVLDEDVFLRNHNRIRIGLIPEAIAFIAIISISMLKPWSAKRE